MTDQVHVHRKIRKYQSASFTGSVNRRKSSLIRVNKVSSCHLHKPRVSSLNLHLFFNFSRDILILVTSKYTKR